MQQIQKTLGELFPHWENAAFPWAMAAEPGRFTPALDPDYKLRRDLGEDIVNFHLSGEIAMGLSGYPGCGKSTAIEQFYAATNSNLLSVTATPRMEWGDLMRKVVPVNGAWKTVDGPLLKCYREGMALKIDEYNLLDEEVQTSLNDVAEGKPIYVEETDELVYPGDGFRLYATMNPASAKMRRNGIDEATADRFLWVNVDYPTFDEEMALVMPIVQSITKIDGTPAYDASFAEQFSASFVKTAGAIRSAYMGVTDAANAMEVTMSTRVLLRWVRLTHLYSGVVKRNLSPVFVALDKVLLHRSDVADTTREAIENFVFSMFGMRRNLAQV